MGDVIDFKGFLNGDINPDELLEEAKGKFKTVIIIGILADDEMTYTASSTGDIFKTLGMIQFANQDILDSSL